MSQRLVAYFGDTALAGPAGYLAGILSHRGIPFRHVRSDEAPPAEALTDEVGLYILSDYPAGQLGEAATMRLCERVAKGAGLLMIGGWGSYHGLDGNYDRSPVAEYLPVMIAGRDDRFNCAQSALVRQVREHAILNGLPLDRPPCIGGLNLVTARDGAEVLLEAECLRVQCAPGEPATFAAAGRYPLLVVQQGESGPAGAGRRACVATDVAPHWVGGLVDWGPGRVCVDVAGQEFEFGDLYAELFGRLVAWCLGEWEEAPVRAAGSRPAQYVIEKR